MSEPSIVVADVGIQGPQGAQGPQGKQGVPGWHGPSGGPVGPSGPTGTTGATGSAEPAGATGPHDVAGPVGFLVPTAIKTANYTAALNDLVLVDCTAGNITITAPPSPSGSSPGQFSVKTVKQDTGFRVTVAVNSGQTFNDDGTTTMPIDLLNQSPVYHWDLALSSWVKLSGDLPLSQLDGQYVPQAQTLALANNTFQEVFTWTVTGQTDDPLPSFGLIAGSASFARSGYSSIQGPFFVLGYNSDHLSGKNSTSPHGAGGMSFFADAGDTNNGAGGHGIEVNPACFVTADGTKGTNALEMVAVDDNSNTVGMAIRCGTGSANGVGSAITLSNSDSSYTFAYFNGLNGNILIYQPITYSAALFTQSVASPVTWNIGSTAGTAIITLAAAGTGNSSQLIMSSAAAQASLILNGAGPVSSQLAMQQAGVNKWIIENVTPYLIFFNAANSVAHAYFIPGASYAAASTWFLSKVTAYSSLIVSGGAALAATATDGFLYLPTVAGVPTGTPTVQAGSAACVFDAVDNRLYVYNGSWKGVGLS